MDESRSKLAISELTFSLYQRSLHPELFTIHAQRHLKTANYETFIWATGSSHVVSVFTRDLCLSELISLPGQMLPRRGLVERFQFRGQRNHKCTLSRGLSYMTDFQVEKMSPNLYHQSCIDLQHFARNRGMFVKSQDAAEEGFEPFSYIDFEARKDEFHLHTFHAFPEQMTIIKTQSLFDFH